MVGRTNIVLIGFMGTGKTGVGRILARVMGKDFVDTDAEIEKNIGLKVEKIFQNFGEERFRLEESKIIKEVARRNNCVIATGGGVVLNPDNIQVLKESGLLIGLTAAPEVIQTRVTNKIRPLLRKPTIERISKLLQEREKYYQVADWYIDTSTYSKKEVAAKILEWWNDHAR